MGEETNITIKTVVEAAEMFRNQAKEEELSLGAHFENLVQGHEETKVKSKVFEFVIIKGNEMKTLIVEGELIYKGTEREILTKDKEGTIARLSLKDFDLKIDDKVDKQKVLYSFEVVKSNTGFYIVFEQVKRLNDENNHIKYIKSNVQRVSKYSEIQNILNRRVINDQLIEIGAKMSDKFPEDDFFA